jgi:hypothetical protein
LRARRRRWLAGAVFAVIAFAAVGSLAADTSRRIQALTRINVAADTIDAFDTRDTSRTRFGGLEFRGGLVLTSSFRPFGEMSGLYMEADGAHFLAVTDYGGWVRGRIVYRDGRPAGIADAEMAPILGADGRPLYTRGWGDAESLTESNGAFYVGIERVEQIVRFDYRRFGLRARGEPIKVPPDFKSFTFNKGLECLAAPPRGAPHAGSLIAVTEHSLDAAGNHRAFVLKADGTVRFTVKRTDDFDVSDCTFLAPADLLLLERRYVPPFGLAIRIRRIPLAAVAESAVVDGRTLMAADLGYQIDNMEGMSVHRNQSGETIITLVSDDNFSPIQRNLLLQFAVIGE